MCDDAADVAPFGCPRSVLFACSPNVCRGCHQVISGDGSEGRAVYDRVSALKIPTLIIHGESDLIVPLRIGQRVADSIAGSTLVVLPKCGHLPHEELPEEVADIIQRFLANLDDV